ncbi:MAG: hypothetical protein N2115_01720 [bacterium]|nr:hypothetical protein [bacterium]
MKVLIWLFILPFMLLGLLLAMLILPIIFSLLSLLFRKKKFFIIKRNVVIYPPNESVREDTKIIDAQWHEEKD